MGPLPHLLFALGVLAADEAGLPALFDAPAAVLLLLPLPYVLAATIRRVEIRGAFALAQPLRRIESALPMLAQLAAVSLFGWHRAVLNWFGEPAMLVDWPDLRLLVSLVPFALLEVLAIDARSRLDGRPIELTRTRSFRLRLFAASAFPLVVYLTGATALAEFPRLQSYLTHVGLAAGAGLVVLVVILGLSFPFALRTIWQTSPLRGRGLDGHRHVLDAVAETAGFRCRELRVWHTGGQVANAAIVGFHPWQRFVFFSDLLLAQLGARELAAVFAHEIGHARRHHVAVFACWTIAFFGGVDLLLLELDGVGAGALLGVFAAFFVAWYFVFGFLSRRFELDADLCSVEIAGDPAALVSAFERIGGAVHANRGTWRHFSPSRRIRFLSEVQADPGVGHRLRRQLRVGTWLGIALFLVVGVLQVRRGWRTWPNDRVVAELAVGEFQRAADLASASSRVDPEWAALAQSAASLATPVDWAGLVRGAMASDDRDEALAWIELASLLGCRELDELRALVGDGADHR